MWIANVLNRIAGSFQPAADRIQAMDFSPRVKKVLAQMAEGLPKEIVKGLLLFLEKLLREEKDKNVQEMTVIELLQALKAMLRIKF